MTYILSSLYKHLTCFIILEESMYFMPQHFHQEFKTKVHNIHFQNHKTTAFTKIDTTWDIKHNIQMKTSLYKDRKLYFCGFFVFLLKFCTILLLYAHNL